MMFRDMMRCVSSACCAVAVMCGSDVSGMLTMDPKDVGQLEKMPVFESSCIVDADAARNPSSQLPSVEEDLASDESGDLVDELVLSEADLREIFYPSCEMPKREADFWGTFCPFYELPKLDVYSYYSRDLDLSELKSLQEQIEREKDELLGRIDSICSVFETEVDKGVINTQIDPIGKSWFGFNSLVSEEKCLQEEIQGHRSDFEFCRHPKIEPFRTRCARLLGIFKSDIEKNDRENPALGGLIIAFLMIFDHTGLCELRRAEYKGNMFDRLMTDLKLIDLFEIL
ncbi:MAG: hypothetical protein LBF54_02525 [Holosporaceae bacterium]|jgi:hypothetical protein|nr:hypothetical protein [Holosporaceae bacterium]